LLLLIAYKQKNRTLEKVEILDVETAVSATEFQLLHILVS